MGRTTASNINVSVASMPMPGAEPDITDAVFRRSFEGSGDGLCLCTSDGVIRLVNHSFCDVFGVPESGLLGQQIDTLLNHESAEMVRQRLSLMRSGMIKAFHRDCQATTAAGREIWLSVSAAVVAPTAGSEAKPITRVEVRDITEARHLERMLVESERRLRSLFNSLSEGFVETDIDNRIVDVNDPLCKMLGYDRDALIGRLFQRFVEPRSRAALGPRRRVQRAAAQRRSFETTLVTRQGDLVDVQIFSTTLLDGSGATVGASAIVLDVTERNRSQQVLKDREARYRTLIESIQDGLVMIRGGVFEYVNAPFAAMLEAPIASITGRRIETVVLPADQPMLAKIREDVLAGLAATEFEIRLLNDAGRLVHVNVHASSVHDQTGDLLAIATVKDVTERRRFEAELRKLSSAVEHSPVSVYITDASGIAQYVNPKFTEITGYAMTEMVGRRPSILENGHGDPARLKEVWDTLDAGMAWRGEFNNTRKDGTAYWAQLSISPIRDENGFITNFVGVTEDITIRKESELLNWRRANFDQVTGLPNRVLFRDRLEQAIIKAKRDNSPLAVMFIDLDRFKAVNDTRGHETGDQVLQQVGQRLSDCIRDSDTVARLAGDEFMALLPEPGSHGQIRAVAERFLDALRRPFDVGGQDVLIGGSIGISLMPSDGDDAATLVRAADAAMYRAKEAGRNTCRYYTADMNATLDRRIRLERDLRQAVEDQQFAVYYQPVVDSLSRQIKGAEALLRWVHPVHGMVPPADFLGVAEDIGLMPDIGRMVFGVACRQCQEWRDKGFSDLSVSVNVSGRQITQPGFVATIVTALTEAGLPATALDIEIPEAALLIDSQLLTSNLMALVELGVRLTIDDFGTGHSSLQQVRKLPFATLKVDQAFVRKALEPDGDAVLLEAVIALARKLKFAVVAEGVETEVQLDYLLNQYCDMFQGFLVGRPLPAAEFEAKLVQGAV